LAEVSEFNDVNRSCPVYQTVEDKSIANSAEYKDCYVGKDTRNDNRGKTYSTLLENGKRH